MQWVVMYHFEFNPPTTGTLGLLIRLSNNQLVANLVTLIH